MSLLEVDKLWTLYWWQMNVWMVGFDLESWEYYVIGEGISSCPLGIYIIFVENMWFWGEMMESLDRLLHFYCAVFHSY
jgi:hypothetical protein